MGCGNSSSAEKKEQQSADEHNVNGKTPLRHLLPQFVAADAKNDRQQLIQQRQAEYEWKFDDNLPPTLKSLPSDEKTLAVGGQFIDMFGPDGATAKMEVNRAMDELKHVFGKGDTDPFEDYTKVFPGEVKGCKWVVEVPKVAGTWKSDKEFGKQRLSGMNPVGCHRLIKGLESIKTKFPITDAMVEGLTEGKTLAELDAAGKLYYTTYEDYEDIQDYKALNGTVYVPFCLFFANSSGDMMPLGIQMYQDPAKSPIFTPNNDHDGLWLLVKICVQQMEASSQIIREHLGGVHFFAEAFYISCRRRLSDHHPVFQLMQDSFWAMLPVNYSGQELLMTPDGKIPTEFCQGEEGMWTVLRRSLCEKNDFNRWVFHKDVEARGVKDTPKYYWRDDAEAGWNVWEKFIGKFIDGIYNDDEDLLKDTEVQSWAEEVSTVVKYENMPITNGQWRTKEQFKFFLTVICWHVTFKHMGIHMTQFEMMAFAPNAPSFLRAPLPMDNTQVFTEQRIRDEFLPEWDSIIKSISFYAGVSYPPNPGCAIGEFTEKFVPKEVPGSEWTHALVKEFQDDLKAMSAKIKKRNQGLDVGYGYLDPENVWRSICV